MLLMQSWKFPEPELLVDISDWGKKDPSGDYFTLNRCVGGDKDLPDMRKRMAP